MTAPAAPRPVDVHALPAMRTALRLPSFQRHWQVLADRADAEGWPASRFLAALAELELAERDARRIHRHLQQSQLPGGKTLATLDVKALPGVTKARIEALAAGDWIETGANLIAIGNSGAGKTHVLCAIGHALVETGRRVLSTSARPTWCRSYRPPAATSSSRPPSQSSTSSISSSSMTSHTPRRIRPRAPCSSN